MRKTLKKILKYLTFAALYIDRFIVAIFPKLSINRIDLQYLDHKNRKNSISRVVILLLLLSTYLNYYYGLFMAIAAAVYVVFWVIKNRIKK